MKIITRFAPSPTGKLHVGNARTAIINWLYAKKHGGLFYLRFDDTDQERSKQEYKETICQDLKWLGLSWDLNFAQSSRLERYQIAKEELLQNGRLYPCFESVQELEIKRKLQLASGKPPIYDRAALKLTAAEISHNLNQGKKPHYRFLLQETLISWRDMIKGEVSYQGEHLSDPIVIREDGSMTYMLCSCVDDIDYEITDIIRGEDHVTNTAIQIQMFEALKAPPPRFAHLGLIKAKEEKISKRIGGFEISYLREQEGFEAMTVNSFFSLIGSAKPIAPYYTLQQLVEIFDITYFSNHPTFYNQTELAHLNHKLLIHLSFNEAKERLNSIGLQQIDEQFWLAVRPNLNKLEEIKQWWDICHTELLGIDNQDKELLKTAAKLLQVEEITSVTWEKWIKEISLQTNKKGKELFLPIRLAITGASSGPEMKNILPLLTREEIIKRLTK